MRFFGNIESRIDAKGRVFLPAVFRKVLQAAGCEQLVVRVDMSGRCLVLYPETVWNERMDDLFARVDEFDDEEKDVLRQWMAEAETLTLDASGRILLSKRLLGQASVVQAVRFIGMNSTIELWAAEKTEQPFLPQAEFADKMKALRKRNA